jgi:hypothetical protein
MLIVLLLSEELLTALEGLRSMGLVRCTVKCKHLLKTVLIRLEEVQMTAEEDKKYVLSYTGYGARHKKCFGNSEKEILP